MKEGDRVRVKSHVSGGRYNGLEGTISGLESASIARGPLKGTPTPAAWVKWETRGGIDIPEAESQTIGAFFVLADLEVVAAAETAERERV